MGPMGCHYFLLSYFLVSYLHAVVGSNAMQHQADLKVICLSDLIANYLKVFESHYERPLCQSNLLW